MAKVSVTVRAYDGNGYSRDILVMNEEQVLISDARIKQGDLGPKIAPADFEEAECFEIIVKDLGQ